MEATAANEVPDLGSRTLEELIDTSRAIKDDLEQVNEQASTLKTERDRINTVILERLESQGLDRIATTRATVSAGERVFASISRDQRADFFAWLVEHPQCCNLVGNALFADSLLEYEAIYGELPPGAQYYRKPTLNMRRR